jgi:hypothetical protein
MAKNSMKTCFLVVLDHFSLKNGPKDLDRGLLLSLDIGPYIPSTCGALCIFLGPFGGAQSAKNSIKNYFLDVLGPFLLQEWA